MKEQNFKETLDELLKDVNIDEELEKYKEYAHQIKKEDDFDDHDEDWYR